MHQVLSRQYLLTFLSHASSQMTPVVLQGLNTAQQRELQSVSLVPVANNTRLLPPDRLFLRLRDDLTPFAFELPAAFTAHTAVLQELGMKQEPSASDLVKLIVVSAQHILTAITNSGAC